MTECVIKITHKNCAVSLTSNVHGFKLKIFGGWGGKNYWNNWRCHPGKHKKVLYPLQQQKQCSEILVSPVASSTALITKYPQQVENRSSASCQNNIFTNTNSPKFVDFGNARFENCNFAFTYNMTKKSDDWSLTLACLCSLRIVLSVLSAFSRY